MHIHSRSDDGRECVLFVSHTADAGAFKVGSHHLAREFAFLGYRVCHVSTPWSVIHSLVGPEPGVRANLAETGPRVDSAGVTHVVGRTLLPAPAGGTVSLPKKLDSLGFGRARYLFIDQPTMYSRGIARLAEISIYRPTDLYLHGIPKFCQARLVPRVNAVAATSKVVRDALPETQGQQRTVIENGVEYERFSGDRFGRGVDAHRDGVAYVGALDDRFDWTALRAFSEALPNVAFNIAGPIPPHPPSMPSNVHLRGQIPYEEVPAFLRSHRVGLIPLSTAPENAGRSPMKLYEYLAAGLYVVMTERGSSGARTLPGVGYYNNHKEGAAHLGRFLGELGPNTDGATVARAQDWGAKARTLLEFAQNIELRTVRGS